MISTMYNLRIQKALELNISVSLLEKKKDFPTQNMVFQFAVKISAPTTLLQTTLKTPVSKGFLSGLHHLSDQKVFL